MYGRISKEFTQRLLLVAAAFVLAFTLAEIGIRIWLPQQFPVHPAGMYSLEPATGYQLTPGFTGVLQRPEFTHTIAINEDGYRGTPPAERQANTFRILILGDSMAFGFGVADHETFAFLLEQQLQAANPQLNIQVINGAVPGYGTVDELALLEAVGQQLAPDLVIVQFFSINDLAENLAPAASWAAIEAGMLTANADGADPDQGFSRSDLLLASIKEKSQFINLLANTAGYLATRADFIQLDDSMWGEAFDENMATLGQELLVEIASTSDRIDAETLFLYSSGQNLVVAENYIPPATQTVVAAAARQSNTPWLDLTEQLQARDDRLELYYPQDGHWNAAGHRAVANILESAVQPLLDKFRPG